MTIQGIDVIHLCDDSKCTENASARAYVIDRKGKVVKSCNVCPKHLEEIRKAVQPNGKYRLREGAACERALAQKRFP